MQHNHLVGSPPVNSQYAGVGGLGLCPSSGGVLTKPLTLPPRGSSWASGPCLMHIGVDNSLFYLAAMEQRLPHSS